MVLVVLLVLLILLILLVLYSARGTGSAAGWYYGCTSGTACTGTSYSYTAGTSTVLIQLYTIYTIEIKQQLSDAS